MYCPKTLSTGAFLLLSSLLGCASVPEGAPDEIQAAHDSIKAADKADASDYTPKTMKAAKEKFADSVSQFKESKSKEDQQALDAAKNSAKSAKQMADNALAVATEVKEADGGDLQAFVDQKQAVGDLATMRAELENARAQPAPATVEGNAAVDGIAYFPTGMSNIDEQHAPELARIVSMMKASPDTQIKLTGRADPRGTADFNDKLSNDRAVAASQFLQAQGIDASRITVEGVGSKDAASSDDPGLLQLDRRVDAQIINTAH